MSMLDWCLLWVTLLLAVFLVPVVIKISTAAVLDEVKRAKLTFFISPKEKTDGDA